MVRTRKEQAYQQMAAEIKTAARLEIRERGTAGISLRALARRLNITAPAVYNYFPSLDDLLTALVVDAFNALADAMQAAGESRRRPRVDHVHPHLLRRPRQGQERRQRLAEA